MPPEKSTRRLGRGLDALFNTKAPEPTGGSDDALRSVQIGEIVPNPYQPRRSFAAADLAELQESMKSSGLLQPVTVRTRAGGRGYELIAGERRLRAATNLGWTEVPAVVKELTDGEMLTLALIENLQRLDLDPIDEAQGYQRLITEFGHTQRTVADLVAKDRSTVANALRILQLPDSVQDLIRQGKLSAGQARPLLGLEDGRQIESLAQQAVDEGWSAREVERRCRELGEAAPAPRPKGGRPRKVDSRPAEVRSIEQQLRKHFQTDVSISLRDGRKGGGTVGVDFYSAEDLERVLELMGVRISH